MDYVPLGEVIAPATLRRAGASTLPILSMTMHSGLVDQAVKFKKRIASLDTAQYKVVLRGQLVVGFPIDEGVLAVQEEYESALVSPAYSVWDVAPWMQRAYLQRFLRSPRALSYYASRLRGTTARRRSLPVEVFLQLPVPRHSVGEQQRIVDVLDHVDGLRAKRRQAISVLDELVKSTFIHMFGTPLADPPQWPLKTLASIGALDRGVSKHRPRNDPRLLGGRYPLVQTGDVARSRGRITSYDATYSDFGLRQSKLWPAGTLCITIAANIAKTGILDFDACFPDSVVGFTSDEATTVYVRAWLGFMQQVLEAAAPMSAQRNINLAILRSLLIPVPPPAELKEFAVKVAEIERLREGMSEDLSHLNELFVSIEQRAFAGG